MPVFDGSAGVEQEREVLIRGVADGFGLDAPELGFA
jgi:hypothetical protein